MYTGQQGTMQILFLAVFAVATAFAIICESPPTPEQCAAIDVFCYTVSEENCTQLGGTVLRNSGICGYCDMCATFVGLGQPCNKTKGRAPLGEMALTVLCKPPLACSSSSDGVCVNENECQQGS